MVRGGDRLSQVNEEVRWLYGVKGTRIPPTYESSTHGKLNGPLGLGVSLCTTVRSDSGSVI